MSSKATVAEIHSLNKNSSGNWGLLYKDSQRALVLSHSINDKRCIAESESFVGAHLCANMVPEQAIEHLKRAEALFKTFVLKRRDLKNMFRMHIAFGIGYSSLGMLEISLYRFEQALKIATQNDLLSEQQEGLVYTGYAHYELGHWSLSISFLNKAVRHSNQDRNLTAKAYGCFASVFEFHKLWEEALPYRLQSTRSSQSIDRSNFFQRLALTFVHLNRLDEAWKSLEIARNTLPKDVEEFAYLAEVYITTGYLYLAQDHLDDAEGFAQIALNMLESQSDIQIYQEAYLLLGQIEFRRGEFNESLMLLKRIDCELVRVELKLRVYALQIEAYEKLEEWQGAYKALLSLQKILTASQVSLHSLHRFHEEIYMKEAAQVNNQVLYERNVELEALNLKKDEQIRIVAHELNNPIGVLQLVLDTCSQHMTNNEGEIRPHLDTCIQTVQQLSRITDRLNAIGKLDEGGGRVKTSPRRLQPEIKNVVSQYSYLAHAKQQDICLEVDPYICGQINPHYFEQVMCNLLSNAIKYSPSGGTVRICAEQRDANWVDVHVKDEGVGLLRSEMTKLFKKYSRLDTRPTGAESSMGLGLYIVKKMVMAMDGRVVAESSGRNMGSTFTVSLLTGNGHGALMPKAMDMLQ